MKCPACGYVSFDLLETCKSCGAPMVATASAPSPAAAGDKTLRPGDELMGLRLEPERPDSGHRVPGQKRGRPKRGKRTERGETPADLPAEFALEVGNDDLDAALADGRGAVDSDDGGPPFQIDDDLFGEPVPGVPDEAGAAPVVPDEAGAAPVVPDWADPGGSWPAPAADLPGPAFALPDGESGIDAGCEPIIDRDDEVPDRYWAPAVAGLGRRALALLVDQAVLAILLGGFFLGAFVTLKLNGFDTDSFLAAAGLHAAALPFALLGTGLSFAYNVFFHGSAGRTPGKALAGIEVRTGDGRALCWSRVIRRWFGAALGLACAGVGILWAVFEPRRRGWADLISGTVIARASRESGAGAPRR